MTSVCFEAFAAMWLYTKKKVLINESDEQIYVAQDNLGQTRTNIELRQKELEDTVKQLGREALAAKKKNQMQLAKRKLTERAEANKRLQKLYTAMSIVNTQIDTIKSNELDKEIMLSLKASSMALKKAGIGINATEVENVIAELNDHIQEAQVFGLVFFYFCNFMIICLLYRTSRAHWQTLLAREESILMTS